MAEQVCDTKVWWRSKTVWATIVIYIIGMISLAEGLTDNKLYLAIIFTATLALGIVLRYLTGQPITLKDLQAVADAALKAKAEHEARSNPALMKSEPWPAPNMDGTPLEEKKDGPPPGG